MGGNGTRVCDYGLDVCVCSMQGTRKLWWKSQVLKQVASATLSRDCCARVNLKHLGILSSCECFVVRDNETLRVTHANVYAKHSYWS